MKLEFYSCRTTYSTCNNSKFFGTSFVPLFTTEERFAWKISFRIWNANLLVVDFCLNHHTTIACLVTFLGIGETSIWNSSIIVSERKHLYGQVRRNLIFFSIETAIFNLTNLTKQNQPHQINLTKLTTLLTNLPNRPCQPTYLKIEVTPVKGTRGLWISLTDVGLTLTYSNFNC